jgi:hypothetical protein
VTTATVATAAARAAVKVMAAAAVKAVAETESRLEGGVNRAKLKFSKIITTTSRVSVRNIIKSAREGAKQIARE